MSKLTQGAESIERLAMFFNDLILARDALRELGGAEQAKSSYEAAALTYKQSADAMKVELEKTKSALEDAKAKLKEQEDELAAQATESKAVAEAEAKQIIEEAKADSIKMRESAKEEITAVKVRFEAAYDAAEKNMAVLQAKREALESECSEKQNELNALNKRIEDAKAAAKAAANALMGD
jgi:hypothetical protein